jgi:hypothetical protein
MTLPHDLKELRGQMLTGDAFAEILNNNGYAIVPKEMTAKMMAESRTHHGQDFVTREQWVAMLAAITS